MKFLLPDRYRPLHLKIYFDVTQFLLQNGFKTPTGISRVELAYAKHMLSLNGCEVNFVTSYPPVLNQIDQSKIERYVAATELCWQTGQGTFEGQQNQASFELVETGEQPNIQVAKNYYVSKRRLAALSAVLSTARPRSSLRHQFNRKDPAAASIYISVSGWRLPTPWVATWLAKRPQFKSIFLLHDIIPLTHPEYVRKRSQRKYRGYLERILRCHSLILANSEDTKKHLLEYCRSRDIATPSVETLRLGAETKRITASYELNATSTYFVVLGTIEPRKNHVLLFEVWKRLMKELPTHEVPRLLIFGKLGWQGSSIMKSLREDPQLKQHITHISGASDEAIRVASKKAIAVLFPSLAEGYGLPLVEALSDQVPVICSDLTVFREIGGRFPKYVNANDIGAWQAVIKEMTKQNSFERTVMIKELAKFKPDSWEQHFEKLDRLIQAVVSPDES